MTGIKMPDARIVPSAPINLSELGIKGIRDALPGGFGKSGDGREIETVT